MKNKIFKPAELIIYGIVLVVLLCTMFFAAQLEILFNLQPDTSKIVKNSLTVHFVDVGQGDAILIKYPNNKTMLIDSGPTKAKDNLFNYINNVFFEKQNNKTFDYVMLTHPDSDHAGNMPEILQTYRVNNFIRPNILVNGLETSESLAYMSDDANYAQTIILLNSLNINTIFAEENLKIADSNYEYMHILTPVKSYYTNENNYSPISKIEFNNVSFLLTGDATTENEIEAINNYDSATLNCDVLKLGHHGSNTSTSLAFLEAVNPSAAVISAGKNNSYLHPSSEVIDRIFSFSTQNNSNLQSNLFQTQNVGNIIFSVNGNNSYLVSQIKNVNAYVFVPYWAVVLLVILMFLVCIIIPKIYKALKKGK